MKKFLKIILIIALIFFIIWGIPMLKCEYLTLQHGHEFDLSAVLEENTMLSEPDWFRILSYNDEYAEIYYISEDFRLGSVLGFKKVQGKWKYDSWLACVWIALGGHADDDVWPYFWHNTKYARIYRAD